MIAISTLDYNGQGDFVFNRYQQSNLHKSALRYQRVATLDGSVAVEIRGSFDADKEAVVTVPFDQKFADVIKSNNLYTVSSGDGCFRFLLASWSVSDSITLEFKGA